MTRKNRRLVIKIALWTAVLCFLAQIFRLVVFRSDLHVTLGQQVYLTCRRDVPIERTIDIVMAADDGYVQNTAATMASILLNCDATSHFRFHILDGGISQHKKDKLEHMKKIRSFELYFYDMTDFDWSIFPDNRDHITLAAYYRLRLCELLPKDIDKALYLDGDLIVEQDLKELWETDLENYALAVIEDEESIYNARKLGLLSKNYFNSGVLLFNLKMLRPMDVFGKSIKYLKEKYSKITYQDQDILNGLFEGKCKFVSLKWNVNAGMYCGKKAEHNYSDEYAEEIIKRPAIIHFTKKWSKPWLWFCIHPLSDEYWKYLRYTGFYDTTQRRF